VLMGNWFPIFRSHYVLLECREPIRDSAFKTFLFSGFENNHESSHPCGYKYSVRMIDIQNQNLVPELILGIYEYIPVAYVTKHCMI
jgi:hypothetical protein